MTAEQRRQERLSRPPKWTTAISRGLIAAGALFLLLAVAFKADIAAAISLSLFAAILYIPGFHLTDILLYRRRMSRRAAEREQRER